MINSGAKRSRYPLDTVIRLSQANPTVAPAGPMRRGTLIPMVPIKRDATPAATMIPAVMGRKPRPVFIGLHPRTFWRNWVRKKNIENTAVPIQNIKAYAPDRFRLAKIFSGINGSLVRLSENPNKPSSTTATHSGTTVPALPQLWLDAFDIP